MALNEKRKEAVRQSRYADGDGSEIDGDNYDDKQVRQEKDDHRENAVHNHASVIITTPSQLCFSLIFFPPSF